MSNLGDYLGQLMSEIAMARMQADLESVRLAEIYAAHPLLRHLPVPHVRLPDVDLDIPVLIKNAEAPRDGETTRGGASPRELRSAFDRTLAAHLDRAGVDLPPATAKRIDTALDARERMSRGPAEMAIDVRRTADEFTATALNIIRDPEAPERGPARAIDEAALKQEVLLTFLQLRSSPPRLDVIVNSAEIREGATNDNVTRIRLKVTEEALEWAKIESNGTSRDLLVPE